MIENPFASPSATDPLANEHAPKPLRPRPWSMLLVGVLLGATIGGTAGGITSGTIGFVVASIHPKKPKDPNIAFKTYTIPPDKALFVGGLLGGVCGMGLGSGVGALVGVVCGVLTPLTRRRPVWLAATLCGVGGGLFGGLAGDTAWSHANLAVLSPLITAAAGAVFAAAVGLVSGAYLGATLHRIAVNART